MKVLIAEDEPVSRKLLESNLRKWGHEVVVTADGEAAIEAFSGDSAIRMVILDWMMPEKDGLAVCRAIKDKQERPFTYVIMLTAKTDKDDIVRALETGADDYISKPFDATELKARVRAGERVIELEVALQQKITELEDALAQVKQLQDIVPICAWCKKIRDDSDYWQSVEDYMEKYSEARFSHGICPECAAKLDNQTYEIKS